MMVGGYGHSYDPSDVNVRFLSVPVCSCLFLSVHVSKILIVGQERTHRHTHKNHIDGYMMMMMMMSSNPVTSTSRRTAVCNAQRLVQTLENLVEEDEVVMEKEAHQQQQQQLSDDDKNSDKQPQGQDDDGFSGGGGGGDGGGGITKQQQLELQSLSAGQIADLVHLQRDHYHPQQGLHQGTSIVAMSLSSSSKAYGSSSDYYNGYDKPLDPFLFPPQMERPSIEPGRLDSRILSLQHKLTKFLEPLQPPPPQSSSSPKQQQQPPPQSSSFQS